MSRRSSADRRRGRLVWLVGLAAISFVILLKAWGQTPLERLTPLVFDLYQRLDPRPEAGAPVAALPPGMSMENIRAELMAGANL